MLPSNNSKKVDIFLLDVILSNQVYKTEKIQPEALIYTFRKMLKTHALEENNLNEILSKVLESDNEVIILEFFKFKTAFRNKMLLKVVDRHTNKQNVIEYIGKDKELRDKLLNFHKEGLLRDSTIEKLNKFILGEKVNNF